MQAELAAEGFVAGRDHIARLRREMGIRCLQKRKFKATTNSNHTLPVAENLLEQRFAPTVPNSRRARPVLPAGLWRIIFVPRSCGVPHLLWKDI